MRRYECNDNDVNDVNDDDECDDDVPMRSFCSRWSMAAHDGEMYSIVPSTHAAAAADAPSPALVPKRWPSMTPAAASAGTDEMTSVRTRSFDSRRGASEARPRRGGRGDARRGVWGQSRGACSGRARGAINPHAAGAARRRRRCTTRHDVDRDRSTRDDASSVATNELGRAARGGVAWFDVGFDEAWRGRTTSSIAMSSACSAACGSMAHFLTGCPP